MGIHHERFGGVGESLEAARRVEAENPAAVAAHKPLVADVRERGDPVGFQAGVRRGVIHARLALVEKGKAAERSHPDAGVITGERRYVQFRKLGMKLRKVFAVVNQDPALLGAQQNPAGGERQHRSELAQRAIPGRRGGGPIASPRGSTPSGPRGRIRIAGRRKRPRH